MTVNSATAELKQLIVEALQAQNITLTTSQVHLERPADPMHGDWATNIALTHWKTAQATNPTITNPRAFAQQLSQQLTQQANHHKWFESIAVAGPGFINFTFSDTLYTAEMVALIESQAHRTQQAKAGKIAVVEYSSPNIAKPFTIGHLRSTIIGDAIANLLAEVGWHVERDNHLGDWGTQFGKQIYALMYLGEGSKPENSHLTSEEILALNIKKIESSERPVKELVALYVEFHQQAEADPTLEERGREWFTKLENGDPLARELWQKCIEWSLTEFSKIYERLGVRFDANEGLGYGESFFEDKMQPVIQELREQLGPKQVYQESQGAELVFFPEEEYPPLMIIKQDGSTLYATRDLATDKFRLEKYGPDVTIINEVGAEQSLYFKQIFRTEELLGWVKPGQRVHVGHGLYRFKDKKMSTRKGNVIWLEDVLNEAVKRAGELAAGKATTAEAAEAIGIGALKWNDLKRSAHLNVTFDWDEILSMQGNSGPYMQYTYVRTRSILDKYHSTIAVPFDTLLDSKVYEPHRPLAIEKNIVRLLTEYFDTLEFAAANYAPHHLCTYAYTLAQAFNTFYNQQQVLELDEAGQLTAAGAYRTVLTAAVGQVLERVLRILGIEPLERM